MKTLALFLAVALSPLSATALAQTATFSLPTDTIRVPGDTVIGGAITIEARILVSGPSSSGVVFNEQSDFKEDKLLGVGPTQLSGYAWRGPHHASIPGPTTWDRCKWTHVAFVAERNTERLYVDGALVGTQSISGTIQNFGGSPMSVGALTPRLGPLRVAFAGSIDWLRISSVARYSGPAVAPPVADPAPDGSTVLLYHFSEAPGSATVIDQGPNGWDGVLGAGFVGATSPTLGLAPGPNRYCTAGTTANGCTASICATGASSASAPTGFSLSTVGVEGSKDGLYFFGTNGRQAQPWGNGSSFQCVVPPVQRTPLLSGSGTVGQCDGSFSRDLNALWCPSCPSPSKNPGAGAVVQAQLWFRDPFNTSNQTTSLSDALEFVVGP